MFLHAAGWVQQSASTMPLLNDLNQIVSTVWTPLFFMSAGLLATRWLYASWSELLSQKVLSLVWVYLLWQVVSTAQSVVASTFTGASLGPASLLTSLALSPARPAFELWFVWALAIFFVVARLCSRFPLAPQLAVGALMGALTFSDLIPAINLGWSGTPSYYLFFLIGCYYRQLLQMLADRFTPKIALGAVGGWLLISTLVHVTGLDTLPVVGVIVRLLGLVAGVGAAVLLQNVQLLSYLGARTIPIYLAHTPVIVLLVAVLHPIVGSVPALSWILPFALTVPAIWLALKLYDTVMRTPLRFIYEPPENLTDLIRSTVGQRRGGAERLPPALVPGLVRQPFDRQIESVLM
ncbi:acyltransferase [Kineosporia mesophila]|nr:acyltransferase [Kineosporia mesophila]